MDASAEIRLHKLERWCAASLRAMTGERLLRFSGHRLQIDGEFVPLRAPWVQLDADSAEVGLMRGVADSMALRLLHSDMDIHRSLQPDASLKILVFDLLEQCRVESQTHSQFPGVKHNLRQQFLNWATQVAQSRVLENRTSMLVYTLSVISWSRLLNEAIPEHVEGLIEEPREALVESIGGDLVMMKKHRSNQQQFAVYALNIAEVLEQIIQAGVLKNGKPQAAMRDKPDLQAQKLNLHWLEDEPPPGPQDANAQGVKSGAVSKPYDAEPGGETGESDYRVFTREYDQISRITSLVREPQLRQFRADLDKGIHDSPVNLRHLVNHLRKWFARPALAGWSFAQEQGYLDASRLPRLLTAPEDNRLFRMEAIRSQTQSIVSVLIDNSGSMKSHRMALAVIVDTLVRAFELADISTEVLGFSTRQWKGGRAWKNWDLAGRPEKPGRLTELCHRVYKTPEMNWRRSRMSIAGMLRPDLYRESVDGEALEWAVGRLEKRPEPNRILMVISDGSPMEAATHLTNGEVYLDRHLGEVSQRVEQRSRVRLCALGVGVDLSACYQRNQLISLQQPLSTREYIGLVDFVAAPGKM